MSKISETTKTQIQLTQQEKSNSTKYNTMVEVFFKAINTTSDTTYSMDEVDQLLQDIIASIEGGNISKGTYGTLAEATNALNPTNNFPDSNKWTVNIDGTDPNGIYKWFQSDATIPGTWVFSSQFIETVTDSKDGIMPSELYSRIKDYPLWATTDGRISANELAVRELTEEISGFEDAFEKLNGLVTTNTANIAAQAQAIKANLDEIEVLKPIVTQQGNAIAGLETNKQNANLAYKGGNVTVEEQIKANEDENIASKTREDNFLKRDSGEMAPGYNAKADKEVVVKETFDNEKTLVETTLKAIQEELAKKANIADLGQKSLIYIPGKGTSASDPVVPIVPTEVGGTLVYDFGTDFATWLTAQVDGDGKPLIKNGNKVEFIIKDGTGITYPGDDSWNNGTATTQPFGNDTNALWDTTTTQLVITTNNNERQVDRTIRQMDFIVDSTAGSSVDQQARNDIAKLQAECQKIAIDLIGITSKTVGGALTELKDRIAAVEDRITGISYDTPSKTTTVSDNVEVGEKLNAKKLTEGGKEVALKEEILDIISVDENSDTVGGVRAAIITSLKDQEGRKSVLFDHAAGTQKSQTYVGSIRKVTVDAIEGGPAYYGVSEFNKQNTDGGNEPYIFDLFLNLVGWKTWQKSLATTDPRRDSRTDAQVDAITQAQLDALPIFQARDEIAFVVDGVNVGIDDDEIKLAEDAVGGL